MSQIPEPPPTTTPVMRGFLVAAMAISVPVALFMLLGSIWLFVESPEERGGAILLLVVALVVLAGAVRLFFLLRNFYAARRGYEASLSDLERAIAEAEGRRPPREET